MVQLITQLSAPYNTADNVAIYTADRTNDEEAFS